MRHEIMVNPVSGKKRGSMYAKRVKNLLHRHGIEANIFESEYAGHLREHAKDVSSQELTRFYSLGGDGTLNEIVSGIYGTDSEIVVLPCGTGNDFARYYNEYESLRSIVLASLHSNASKIDIMKLNNDRYCVNILNGGFDALIAENMNKFRWVPFLSGTGKYNAAIFYTLVLGKGYPLEIKVDDKKFKGKYTLFAISNARYYGGGVVPCKNATPDDGILSICLVKNTSIFEKVILLPKYKASKHENISKVYINDEVKKINIHSNVDFPLSIDGEVSMVKELECEIIPEAINIVKIKKETKI